MFQRILVYTFFLTFITFAPAASAQRPEPGSMEALYGANVARTPGTAEELAARVDAGETVTIPVRLNSGVGIINMVNGAISIKKNHLSFTAACCWVAGFRATIDWPRS